MTVVFGFPSAEQVTITAGVPFSRTGRISDGRRVIGISSLDRWDEARPRTWSGRLQINLDHLEVDGHRCRRHIGVQHVFRCVGIQLPKAPRETPSDALHGLMVVVLNSTVAEVASFELICLV